MRASYYPAAPYAAPVPPPVSPPRDMCFSAFTPSAFALAAKRRVPVFLLIGEAEAAFSDPALAAHLSARTVPVRIAPGEAPDTELLCRRCAALYSREDALPLCALLFEDGLPFLAAPLPPAGYPLDAARLLTWLTHADRRLSQNRPAMRAQAAGVLRSFEAPALHKPYSPRDAAHDLLRAALAAEDGINGGFFRIKTPRAPLLLFLERQAARGERRANDALQKALDAMRTGALLDPVDGLFFSSTLTDDWRVFVPEKPLAVNALLALTLLRAGERSAAIRMLEALLGRFSLSGGGFAPALRAPKSRYTFTPEQVTAALGSEDGLRACRLLGLLHRRRRADPDILPSRFSPAPPAKPLRPALDNTPAPLCPQLEAGLLPEDEAFLRRALPVLSHARAARGSEVPCAPMLTADCAIAAFVFAVCAERLGETRYEEAAQRAVHALLTLMPGADTPGVPAPVSALRPFPACGASAALSLALLALARRDASGAYAASGFRLLGSALSAFVRPDGMIMHTPPMQGGLPRVPAIFDSELPSPAALLMWALHEAQALRPDTPYREAAETIFAAAAPYMKHDPLACASLIDAASATLG